MKYSAKYFKDTMPKWKRDKDAVVARYIHRPISFYFSEFFVSIGLTANQVSFIALIIAFLSCVSFLFNNVYAYLIGAILMNLWSIVDSADGNIARSIGGKPYGDFIDATSSYALVGFIFPILGLAVYRDGGVLFEKGNITVIYIGALASTFDTMARLYFQKMKSDTFEMQLNEEKSATEAVSIENESTFTKIRTRIESELGLGGWNMLAIFVCIFTNSLDLYVSFYALYYGAIFIFSTVYLIKKTGCLKN